MWPIRRIRASLSKGKIIDTNQRTDDFLAHHGIAGMSWGKRKAVTTSEKPTYGQKTATSRKVTNAVAGGLAAAFIARMGYMKLKDMAIYKNNASYEASKMATNAVLKALTNRTVVTLAKTAGSNVYKLA